MEKTSRLSRFFKFFWLVADEGKFNKEWDQLLKQLILNGKITAIDKYSVEFNNKYTVWIENHPWSSGGLYRVTGYEKTGNPFKNIFECSKPTKILLEDKINEYLRDGKKTILEKQIELDIQNMQIFHKVDYPFKVSLTNE